MYFCLLSGEASSPLEKNEGFALVLLYLCDLSAYSAVDQEEHVLCLPIISTSWTHDLRGCGVDTR